MLHLKRAHIFAAEVLEACSSPAPGYSSHFVLCERLSSMAVDGLSTDPLLSGGFASVRMEHTSFVRHERFWQEKQVLCIPVSTPQSPHRSLRDRARSEATYSPVSLPKSLRSHGTNYQPEGLQHACHYSHDLLSILRCLRLLTSCVSGGPFLRRETLLQPLFVHHCWLILPFGR